MPISDNILAIPFYGSEELIENFVHYFKSNQDVRYLFKSIIIINDKPGGNAEYLSNACEMYSFEYLENYENLGYLNTCNNIIRIAIEQKCNLVLLNSDTIPHGDCFNQLLSCFEDDDRIGVVCPRSNNASVANFYDRPVSINHETIISDFINLRCFLPKVTYAPISVGFCFALRWSTLKEFGAFDEIYKYGYEEENDFCMRISEYGYRSAICNYALVLHQDGVSFSEKLGVKKRNLEKDKNLGLLNNRYPYYLNLISEFKESPENKAVFNLTSTWDNTIFVDVIGIGTKFSGSSEVAINYIKGLVLHGCFLDIYCTDEEYKFHKFNEFGHNRHITVPSRYYKSGLRIGQPFLKEAVFTVPKYSLMPSILILDTIAIDCGYLCSKTLHEYWLYMNRLYSKFIFISNYSKKQYELKYGKVSNSAVLLLSTSPKDYFNKPNSQLDLPEEFYFIAGNGFKHKGLELIIPFILNDGRQYFCLSDRTYDHYNIKFLESGSIDDDFIESLYKGCRAIIYPSHYEGFGFPLMKAIAYGKPIVCRPLGPFSEIIEEYGAANNVFNFNFSSEINEILKILPNSILASNENIENDWSNKSRALKEYITKPIYPSFEHLLDKHFFINSSRYNYPFTIFVSRQRFFAKLISVVKSPYKIKKLIIDKIKANYFQSG